VRAAGPQRGCRGLLEGQQLHASGLASEKCAREKPQARHAHAWARKIMGQFFLGTWKKKERRNQARFKGGRGGRPPCCSPKAKALGGSGTDTGTSQPPQTAALLSTAEPRSGRGKGEEGFALQNENSCLENANLKA